MLAVSLPEIYVSRTPFSEPLVQVLLFGGLCMFIDSFGVVGGGMALAGLGGLALGLTVLTWIGSLSILLPAFPVLAWLFVARRRQAAPFGIGLFLGIAIGLAAALTLGRSYLSTVSSELHVFGLAAAAFGLATALIAPLAVPEVRARVWRVFTRRLRAVGLAGEEISLPSLAMIVQWAAVALPVIALIVLAFRPYVQTVVGQTNPVLVREVAALQRLAGLPVDGRRQYYEQSFNWVLWYLGVPAVLLACAGAAVLGRRLVRAVIDGRSSIVAARLWGLPFLIIAWSVGTVLWDPAVAPWQPWASHRLVPVVLPGLVLFGVWGSSRVTVRAAVLGASRLTVALVAICCVLALAIPPVVTSLNPGIVAHASVGRYSSGLSKFVSRVRLRGVGAASTYAGSVGGGDLAVRLDRAVRQRGVRQRLDRGRVRADRAGALRGSDGVDGGGLVVGLGRAGGDRNRAGRPAPGAARLVARGGVAVRGRAARGLVAAHDRRRQGADRPAGRELARLVHGVDGLAAWVARHPRLPREAGSRADLLLHAGVHRVKTSPRGGAVR